METECDHGSNPASCPVCLGPLPAPPVRGSAAAAAAASSSRPMHLLVKWEPDADVDVLGRYREVAEREGSTWWGCESEGTGRRPAQKRLDQIALQARQSTPTHAYMYCRSADPDEAEVWKADIIGTAADEAGIDPTRRPDGVETGPCYLYLELSGFERVQGGWVTERLNLYAPPDGRRLDATGLANATTPLFVFEA